MYIWQMKVTLISWMHDTASPLMITCSFHVVKMPELKYLKIFLYIYICANIGQDIHTHVNINIYIYVYIIYVYIHVGTG